MEVFLLIIHVLVALGVIGLVLLQHGKGADMGAAFGAGSSGSLFGASGSANFLSRTTAILATVFFATSIALTYFSHEKANPLGLMEKHAPQAPASAPAPADKPVGVPLPSGAPGQASKAKEVPN